MDDPIQAITAALEGARQPTDIEKVYPLIVPRSCFAPGDWPGPYESLRSPLLGLTWTVVRAAQTMAYVSREQTAVWTTEQITWKEQAMANLWWASRERLWTHEKRDEDGRLLWACLTHADGLGSSRLLLREQLLAAAKGDYRVGIPDRSCGMIVPKSAGEGAMAEVAEMVRSMFDRATIPILPELFDPRELESVLP